MIRNAFVATDCEIAFKRIELGLRIYPGIEGGMSWHILGGTAFWVMNGTKSARRDQKQWHTEDHEGNRETDYRSWS